MFLLRVFAAEEKKRAAFKFLSRPAPLQNMSDYGYI
jgi:hypothetical protein